SPYSIGDSYLSELGTRENLRHNGIAESSVTFLDSTADYPQAPVQHNLKALEDVWDYSYQHVPYYGTNTPIDECYECGFTGEFECT
ncbi:hypothetical protein MJM28_29850, partial [Salmonella enterica subsp. enterica serovar Montevideo]|nr:hypothetical protein [Salmonella enterica subsp. enterica serovar Montevideo]